MKFRSCTHALILIGTLVLTSIIDMSRNPALGCSADPIWQDTLRCKLFPNETPPPPPAPPASVNEIADFTRVDLLWPNDNVRCVDGTVPHIYVDAAHQSPSNKWVITMQGGGACNGGEACLGAYLNLNEQDEMTTARDPTMKNMQGIHRHQPRNTFANFNRIRVKKCGYDRYNGDAMLAAVEATVDSDFNGNGVQGELINDPAAIGYDPSSYTLREGDNLTFTLFHHGRRILDDALVQLRDGLAYETWRDVGDEVTSVRAILPPLKDAEMILFAGHSGAAHGLMNSIDDLVDNMATWSKSDGASFDADIRAMFDAQLLPSLESEAAFNEHLDGDVYDHLTLCRAPCESGPPLRYTYDGMAYFDSGGVGVADFFDGPHLDWNVHLDTSCQAAHPTDAWRCADRFHVLFNHITTPFFVREDLRDPNGQHNNNPAGPENGGHRLFWAEPSLAFCNDPDANDPCAPVLSPADYRARVEEQAERLIEDFANRSELARDGFTVPTVYLWLPSCEEHAGAFDDVQFFDVSLDSTSLSSSKTLHDFLLDFLNDVPDGLVSSRIDADGDMVSICP